MGLTTGRCRSDIIVESIFTLEHHHAVSIILLVDVLRPSFQLRSRRVFVFATAATWRCTCQRILLDSGRKIATSCGYIGGSASSSRHPSVGKSRVRKQGVAQRATQKKGCLSTCLVDGFICASAQHALASLHTGPHDLSWRFRCKCARFLATS